MLGVLASISFTLRTNRLCTAFLTTSLFPTLLSILKSAGTVLRVYPHNQVYPISLLHSYQNVPMVEEIIESSLYYIFHINLPLNELSQSFYLTYSTSNFLLITLSILNSFSLALATLFYETLQKSSQLKSLITYVP